MKLPLLRRITIIMCLMIILSAFHVFAVGDMPDTHSYTYSANKKIKQSPVPFTSETDISSFSLNTPLKAVNDIAVDSKQNVYLLDTETAQILLLSPDYKLQKIINRFINDGNNDSFLNPEDIFVDDNKIYIADTGNKRIVILNKSGDLINIISEPDKQLTQADYEYEPAKVAADFTGRILVLARNQTQGVMQFSEDGKFLGYIGAAKVVPNPVELFFRRFATKKQLESMLLFIPTEYNNITVDSKGFMYATIGNVDPYQVLEDIDSSQSKAPPIRKINLQGNDVLKRNGAFPPVGDLKFETEGENAGSSTIVDVALNKYGFYSLLDSKRGRIFTYNDNGELLYIFGSCGNKTDQFDLPVAIEYQGDNILVADKLRKKVQVFKPTKYALKIAQAHQLHASGEYDSERLVWEDVLLSESSCDLAYTGLGKAYFIEQDYSKAMEYFKRGNNTKYYSEALKKQRKEEGSKLLLPLFILLAVIIVLCVSSKLIIKKKKILFGKKHNIQQGKFLSACNRTFKGIIYAFYIMIHPFDGFWDVKYEKRGNAISATIILILATILNVITLCFSGFLFGGADNSDKNILVSGILGIILVVLLWVIATWCFTTLMDGKGNLKDIYVYTCYSLSPGIIFKAVLLILSHVMSLDEMAVYTLISTISVIWIGYLIFCGTLVTHHYSPVKTIGSIILTIIGMGIMVFIGILAVCLVQQMTIFIQDIAKEIAMRM